MSISFVLFYHLPEKNRSLYIKAPVKTFFFLTVEGRFLLGALPQVEFTVDFRKDLLIHFTRLPINIAHHLIGIFSLDVCRIPGFDVALV